ILVLEKKRNSAAPTSREREREREREGEGSRALACRAFPLLSLRPSFAPYPLSDWDGIAERDNGFCNPQPSSHPCLIPHHSLSGISPFSRIPESRLLLSLHHPILSTITNIVSSNPVLACFPFYWVKATSLDS
ncbi:unnamed protein product, partial [Musa acuminata subsp. burmannicoides]